MNALDIEQAAALLRLHPNSFRKMAARGEVPAARVGRSYVAQYADNHRKGEP